MTIGRSRPVREFLAAGNLSNHAVPSSDDAVQTSPARSIDKTRRCVDQHDDARGPRDRTAARCVLCLPT
jgi:hypothetical protein